METPPDDLVLRDILLRQIRKCQLMKYDIEAFDRAPEKSEQKSYAFLLRNIRDLLDRERLRSNRNRIVEKNKQTAKSLSPLHPLRGAKIAAKERATEVEPVAVARVEKGTKYATNSGMANVKRVKTVPTSMVKDSSRSGTPKRKGKGKGGSRSGFPNRKSKEEMAKIPLLSLTSNRANVVVVTNCFYKHEVAAANFDHKGSKTHQ